MTNKQIQLRVSEIEQELKPYTISWHEELHGLLIGETFTAAERAKVEALLTELKDLEIRKAALVAEGEEEARRTDEHNRTQKQDCP